MLEDTVFEDYLQSQVYVDYIALLRDVQDDKCHVCQTVYVVFGHEEIFNINKL